MEKEIIQWILGIKKSISETTLLSIDVEKLSAFLKEHKLTNRFFLQMNKINEFSKYVIKFQNEWLKSKEKYERQLGAFRHINNKLNKEKPLILIKGFSAFAITGELELLKSSSDLDVFYFDENKLEIRLKEMNYVEFGLPSEHEYLNLVKKEGNFFIIFDVHKYYPVYNYPEGLEKKDLELNRNSRDWKQYFSSCEAEIKVKKKIFYEDILKYSKKGITAETKEFFFPTVEMTIILLCCSMFKDFLYEPYKFPNIKLVDLATIRGLSMHKSYNHEKLINLIEEFEAFDAVSFINILLKEQYGEILISLRKGGNNIFQKVQNGLIGGWIKRNDINQLLTENMYSRLAELGQNEIWSSNQQEEIIYDVLDNMGGNRIKRTINWSNNGVFLPFQFSVFWENDYLAVKIKMTEILQPQFFVMIHLDNKNSCTCVVKAGEDIRLYGKNFSKEVVYNSSQLIVIISIKLEKLINNVATSTVIPCFLCMSSNYDEDKSHTTVPILIRKINEVRGCSK